MDPFFEEFKPIFFKCMDYVQLKKAKDQNLIYFEWLDHYPFFVRFEYVLNTEPSFLHALETKGGDIMKFLHVQEVVDFFCILLMLNKTSGSFHDNLANFWENSKLSLRFD